VKWLETNVLAQHESGSHSPTLLHVKVTQGLTNLLRVKWLKARTPFLVAQDVTSPTFYMQK